jgi:hypothetical protein
MNMDEEATSTAALPVINGWTIPGDDGWEIIAMVADRERIATARSNISRAKHKREKVVVTVTSSGF